MEASKVDKTQWQVEEVVKHLTRIERKLDRMKKELVSEEKFKGFTNLNDLQIESTQKQIKETKSSVTWLVRGVIGTSVFTVIVSTITALIVSTIVKT